MLPRKTDLSVNDSLPLLTLTSETGVLTPDAHEPRLPPIACTLGQADGAARLEQWRRVPAACGLGSSARPGRVTVRFRDDAG
jgi:hypothetical protein